MSKEAQVIQATAPFSVKTATTITEVPLSNQASANFEEIQISNVYWAPDGLHVPVFIRGDWAGGGPSGATGLAITLVRKASGDGTTKVGEWDLDSHVDRLTLKITLHHEPKKWNSEVVFLPLMGRILVAGTWTRIEVSAA